MEEEINPLAQKMMSLLVFEESFEALLSELPEENAYALTDELKQLIVKDFVKPCRDLDNQSPSGLLYDSDRLQSYSFRLTSKGINTLEKNLKTK